MNRIRFIFYFCVANQLNKQLKKMMKSNISSSTKPSSYIFPNDEVSDLKNEITQLKNILFKQNQLIAEEKSWKQLFQKKFQINEKKRKEYQARIKILINQLKIHKIPIKKQWQLLEENTSESVEIELMISSKHTTYKDFNELRSNSYQRMDTKLSLETVGNMSKQKNTKYYLKDRNDAKNDLVIKFLKKRSNNELKSPDQKSVLLRKEYNLYNINSSHVNKDDDDSICSTLKSLRNIKSAKEIPKKMSYFDKRNQSDLSLMKND